MHIHSTATALVHILDLLSLLNVKSLALTLTTNPPLRFELNTRVPAPDRSMHSPTSHVGGGRCLAVEGGLVACGLDDVFPEVSSRGRCGGVCGQGGFAGGCAVFEVRFEEFEVVPDFAGLIVAAVGLAFEDRDIGL